MRLPLARPIRISMRCSHGSLPQSSPRRESDQHATFDTLSIGVEDPRGVSRLSPCWPPCVCTTACRQMRLIPPSAKLFQALLTREAKQRGLSEAEGWETMCSCRVGDEFNRHSQGVICIVVHRTGPGFCRAAHRASPGVYTTQHIRRRCMSPYISTPPTCIQAAGCFATSVNVHASTAHTYTDSPSLCVCVCPTSRRSCRRMLSCV